MTTKRLSPPARPTTKSPPGSAGTPRSVPVLKYRLEQQGTRMRLSELSPEIQEYMKDYIESVIPRNRVVYHWFDVYDMEEKRL